MTIYDGNTMTVFLVTGSAGFIGFHVAKRLLDDGHRVIGVDNMNHYYDIEMKERRNEILLKYPDYSFCKVDLADFTALEHLFEIDKPEMIIHLAAQAGVRYSLENPWAYAQSNYIGAMNIFELAKRFEIPKIIYASSSSVYGSNDKFPFEETDTTDIPISLYAATKKANEVLAHSYSKLYGIEMVGLRFFTVYGEFNRPDMALFKFAKNILLEKPIEVYNNGEMYRAFTYVGDIVDGIIGLVDMENRGNSVYNIGGEKAHKLTEYIELLEKHLDKKAIIEFKPMHKADCVKTEADVSKAKADFGYEPKVSLDDGIKIFADWFLKNKTWTLELKDARQ